MSPLALLAAAARGQETSSRLEWRSLPSSSSAFGTILLLLGLAALFVLLYRRETASTPAPRRLFLAFVRLLVLLAAFLILWEPVLVRDLEEVLDGNVVIAVDASKSMDFPDVPTTDLKTISSDAFKVERAAGEKVARAVVVRRLLQDESVRFVEGLRKKNHVRVGIFSRAWEPLETFEVKNGSKPAPAPPPPGAPPKKEPAIPFDRLAPRGGSTDLAAAIRAIVDGMNGEPLAAVILFSDGQHNEGEDPKAAAAYAASRGAVFLVVGLGDPSPFKNVRVSNPTAPEVVNKKDPVPISVVITEEGYPGQSVDVEVTKTPKTGGTRGTPQILKRETIPLPAEGTARDYLFQDFPEEAGEFLYGVAVKPVEGERVKDDNRGEVLVRVLDDKRKVLLVAGSPTREYQFVKNLLVREKAIDVSCFLQSMDPEMPQEGDVRITKVPDQEEDLFAYDAVILVDPDPSRSFDARFGEMLKRFVTEQGGGLLFVAGEKYTTRFLGNAAMEPILDLLPVLPDFDAPDAREASGRIRRREFKVAASEEVLANPAIPILGLAPTGDAADSRRIWETMPGIYWFYPIRQEKPLATVLARASDPSEGPILLAAQIVGTGRSVFQAFDETWRFRKIREAHFDRYWIQANRFLFQGRLEGRKGRVRISVDPAEPRLGQAVRFFAKAQDKNYRPLDVPSLKAIVRPTEGAEREVVLASIPGKPGQYQGEFIPDSMGLHDVWVPEEGAEERAAAQHFKVVPSNLEIENPRLNDPLLREIAQITNGRYLTLAEAVKLPDKIESRQQRNTISSAPESVWDRTWTMLLVALLLSLEWFLRKRWRMI